MTMAFAEGNLRATGDPRDAAYADVIAGILAARGEDIPLPTGALSMGETSAKTTLESAGRVALITGVELPGSVDSLDEEYSKRVALSVQATEKAQPYIDAIGANLLLAPPPSRLSRWMGRNTYKQEITQTIGSRTFDYTYTTRYKQLGEFTTPTSFQMELNPGSSGLGISIDANSLYALNLYWGDKGEALKYLYKENGGKSIGSLIDVMPFAEWPGVITINLDYEKLGVNIASRHNSDSSEKPSFETNFVYMPQSDIFEERFMRGHAPPQTLRTIESAEFLDIVDSSLKIIPTISAPIS